MAKSINITKQIYGKIFQRGQQTAATRVAPSIRPLVDNEPEAPYVRTPIPGPKSKLLLSDLNSIQNVGSVTFFADYEKSRGNYMMDADGNLILDCMMQIASIPLGYNSADFMEAMQDPNNLSHLINRPSLGVNPPIDWPIRMRRALMRVAPRGMTNVQTMMCGACSVEHAFKAAFMAYRRKQRGGEPISQEEMESSVDGYEPGCPPLTILSFKNAFHGRTIGAMSCTHSKWAHRLDFPGLDWPYASFPQLKYPLEDYVLENRLEEIKCLEEARQQIIEYNKKGHPVAGVIVEPIQAEGGDKHASNQFFRDLQQLCKEFGAYFIVDEVQTGMGGTGTVWKHEQWDLPEPADLVAFSKKALTGGFYHTNELRPQEGYRLFNTWMGDPHKIVLLEKLIDVMERDNLLDNVREMGEYWHKEMDYIKKLYPNKINAQRGSGAFLGFDTTNTEQRDKIQKSMLQKGVNIGVCGVNTMRMRPSLVFQKHHVDIFLDALVTTLKEN